MRSIRGALTRPSSRPTTRLSLTSASVGTVVTRNRSATWGCSSTSTCATRRRMRSLRARWATRLSIRRAGPEWAAPKNTSNGRESRATSPCFPCKRAVQTHHQERVYTLREMWEWYRIGLSSGLGSVLGSLLAAVVAPRRAGVAAVLGAVVAARLVLGTLERGGTRGGTAVLVGLGALILAALALVPAVGYLEAVTLPALAARARGRRVERVAGLRSLARD